MSDPIYNLVELIGTSSNSIEEAVAKAIKDAKRSIKSLRWFQVVDTRGSFVDRNVHYWQVRIKIAFAEDLTERSKYDRA